MTSIKSLLGQRYSLVCCLCFYMNLLGLGLSSTSKISSGYVDWPVVYGKCPLQFAFMWGGAQCFWAFLQFLFILEKNKLDFLLVNYQTKCMFGLYFKKKDLKYWYSSCWMNAHLGSNKWFVRQIQNHNCGTCLSYLFYWP
jgi:hypothetical protein